MGVLQDATAHADEADGLGVFSRRKTLRPTLHELRFDFRHGRRLGEAQLHMRAVVVREQELEAQLIRGAAGFTSHGVELGWSNMINELACSPFLVASRIGQNVDNKM